MPIDVQTGHGRFTRALGELARIFEVFGIDRVPATSDVRQHSSSAARAVGGTIRESAATVMMTPKCIMESVCNPCCPPTPRLTTALFRPRIVSGPEHQTLRLRWKR